MLAELIQPPPYCIQALNQNEPAPFKQHLATKGVVSAVPLHLQCAQLELTSVGIYTLVQALLQTRHNLVALDLSNNPIDDIQPSAHILAGFSLRTLILRNLNLGKKATLAVDPFYQHPSLEVLDLSNNHIDVETMHLTLTHLQACPKLHTLNLSNNPFTPPIARYLTGIANSLSIMRNLSSLDISHNKLNESGKEFIDILFTSKKLHTLNISGNNLKETAVTVAKKAQENGIKRLKLASNATTTEQNVVISGILSSSLVFQEDSSFLEDKKKKKNYFSFLKKALQKNTRKYAFFSFILCLYITYFIFAFSFLVSIFCGIVCGLICQQIFKYFFLQRAHFVYEHLSTTPETPEQQASFDLGIASNRSFLAYWSIQNMFLAKKHYPYWYAGFGNDEIETITHASSSPNTATLS